MRIEDLCEHPFLRCDEPQETGQYNNDGTQIMLPLFTCANPYDMKQCLTTLAGKNRIAGYPYVYKYEKKIYYAKNKLEPKRNV